MTVVDLLGNALVGAGTLLILLAAVGLLRLPDVYSRLHATGMAASLGIGLVLIGSAVLVETVTARIALILAVSLQFAAGPFATHAITRAAHRHHAPMWQGTVIDELRHREATGLGVDQND